MEYKTNKIYSKNKFENDIFKEKNNKIIYINKEIDSFNFDKGKIRLINIIEGYECSKKNNIIETETREKTKYFIIESM